mgnify:CR=1 FL=1
MTISFKPIYDRACLRKGGEEAMWPSFEEAFDGFSPNRWAMMSDEDLEGLVSDKRVFRNGQKLK